MVVKQEFSRDILTQIFQSYSLGRLIHLKPLTAGTVQTNIWIQTTSGEYVFKYYKNRTRESVLFEIDLLTYLNDNHFPCPVPCRNNRGEHLGMYRHKPYVVFEFIEGQHIQEPNVKQRNQLIQKVAQLHNITENYSPAYKESRWNYNAEFCLDMAQRASQRVNTESARQKLSWLEKELQTLELPNSLPKGICHSDFTFTNILFRGNEFCALLDFDDANYTYLTFDVVGLVESWAWRYDKDIVLNFAYSGVKQPPIPENSDRAFRRIAATRSEKSRPPIPENHGHLY
ncbi:MAG: homoserine kinase [Alicyclobacillus sp.]|nr:homoserine kinase [Alicyclobacillus sp.]